MERQGSSEEAKRSLAIGVDIDEVVAAHFRVLVSSGYNPIFGTELTIEDIEYRHFLEDHARGLKGEEGAAQVLTLYSDERFYFEEVFPLEGAQEAISKLIQDGHNIHFITTREPHLAVRTLEWLTLYGFPATQENFHFRATLDEGGIDFKIRKAEELGLNLFIEDDSRVAERLDIPTILIDYRWNRASSGSNTQRVTNWEQIYQHIQNLAKAESPPKES